MIVCHCNVINDRQIRDVLAIERTPRPRTAGQVYKCMNCRPECGRCLPTIQRMLVDHGAACQVGCAVCPAGAMVEALQEVQAAHGIEGRDETYRFDDVYAVAAE